MNIERYSGKAAVIAAFLLISGGFVTEAAAQVAVSPLRIDLNDHHNKDEVRITNQESGPRSYEVEIVAWSQTDERREVYSPTEDIIAVPPLFTLAPGEEQVVRVGMLTEADPSIERSYRMFVTELASPQPEEQSTSGIKMRLQFGLPVFVAPAALPSASLDYFDSMRIDDQFFMHLRNHGNTHVKISEVQYLAPGKEEPVTAPAVIYILARQTGYVSVELPGDAVEGKVTLVTDTLGDLEYELSPSS